MKASRSGYYNDLNTLSHQQSTDKETPLWGAIKGLATQRHHRYGSRRMAKALHMQGYPVGRYRAGRLMGKAGIRCLQRRRYVMTTQRQPSVTSSV